MPKRLRRVLHRLQPPKLPPKLLAKSKLLASKQLASRPSNRLAWLQSKLESPPKSANELLMRLLLLPLRLTGGGEPRPKAGPATLARFLFAKKKVKCTDVGARSPSLACCRKK